MTPEEDHAHWVAARQRLHQKELAPQKIDSLPTRVRERLVRPLRTRLGIEIAVVAFVLALLASWAVWETARRGSAVDPIFGARTAPYAWTDPGPRAGLERKLVRLEGGVGASLSESILRRGGSPRLAREFAEIFAWDIDFATQADPNDAFAVVYERLYDGPESVRTGRILAARYRRDQQELVAIWFEQGAGAGDYYTPTGSSVRRPFLRAPLPYTRISSRYSRSRLHPILQVWRPHPGIDYAAPMGTPIWAVADGEVVYRGWDGPNGRLVKVRHPDGYVSYYSHLSRFARGVRLGVRVRQKGVLGYVGSSGLSTGPHLDYRLAQNGRFLDPTRMPYPRGPAIEPASMPLFHDRAARGIAVLDGVSPPAILTDDATG